MKKHILFTLFVFACLMGSAQTIKNNVLFTKIAMFGGKTIVQDTNFIIKSGTDTFEIAIRNDSTIVRTTTTDWGFEPAIGAAATGWGLTGNSVNGSKVFGTTGAGNDTLNIVVAGTKAGIIDNDLSNVAFGGSSLLNNSSGTNNTALGRLALSLNTIGSNNTAIGTSSNYITSGDYNTSVGAFSMGHASGSILHNTAVGYYSLDKITSTAQSNVGVGNYTGANVTSATQNTFIGYGAGYAATTGGNNTSLGYLALLTCTSGVNNTTIGTQADVATATTNNAIAIGYGAVAKTNQLAIPSTITSVKLGTLPEYANDAAAGAGGLVAGELYQTTTGGSSFVKIKQ